MEIFSIAIIRFCNILRIFGISNCENGKHCPKHDSYNFIFTKGYAYYVQRKSSEYKCGFKFLNKNSNKFSLFSLFNLILVYRFIFDEFKSRLTT